MEGQNWLSAEEISKKVNVSSMTIKRWCNQYGDYINFRQEAKGKYYIHLNSLDVLKRISKFRSRNLQQQDILQRLESEGFSKVFSIEQLDDDEPNIQTPMMTPPVPLEVIAMTKDDLRELIAAEVQKGKEGERAYQLELVQLSEQRILSKIDEDREERRQWEKTRSEQLDNALRQIASTKAKKSWWKFW